MSIDTLSEIVSLLNGTILAAQKAIELPIPQSEEIAFAIEVDAHNAYAAWELMRSQIDITGRYPIIVDSEAYPNPIDDWEESTRQSNTFSRTFYEQEWNRVEQKWNREENATPRMIIARSKSFDVNEYIAAEDDDFLQDYFDDEAETEECLLRRPLEELEKRYGKAPKIEELLNALGLADRQLGVDISGEDIHEAKREWWLFEWVLANVDYDLAIAYEGEKFDRDWFGKNSNYNCDRKYALILLPVANSWESLAYIHWYGSLATGSDGTIAFLKRWHEGYQAELVCHFGTVLHFKVGRQPSTPQEAFNLSVEHFTLSRYGLECFGIADYARYLMQTDIWYFHERP